MTVKAITLGLLLAATCTTAFAQSTTSPATNPPAASPATPPAAAQPMDSTASPSNSPAAMQAQIASDLKNAGYSGVMVQPGSYIAQGKKNGDTVTLLIGPGSVTEIVMGDAVKTGTSSSPQPQATSDMFTTVPSADGLSSQVVGTSVTNRDNASVGTIKDVAFTLQGAVKAYILGVGGFLGMGDRYVAVRPSAVKLTYDTDAKKWKATMDTNADALKTAPEYKYPS